MKRRLILLGFALVLTFSLIALQLPATAKAQGSATGKVTAFRLNFRSGPAVKASRLELLKRGAEVIVLGKNAKGTWLKIQVDNLTGWVSSRFIKLSVAIKMLPVAV